MITTFSSLAEVGVEININSKRMALRSARIHPSFNGAISGSSEHGRKEEKFALGESGSEHSKH